MHLAVLVGLVNGDLTPPRGFPRELGLHEGGVYTAHKHLARLDGHEDIARVVACRAQVDALLCLLRQVVVAVRLGLLHDGLATEHLEHAQVDRVADAGTH
eukprot:447882-Hanusia_phi.AAC.1